MTYLWTDRRAHLRPHLSMMAMMGYFVFLMLLIGRFDLIRGIKSEEVRLDRISIRFLRLISDITVDLAVRDTHVQYGADLQNSCKCLKDVQDSAYPKDT
jgi:hypothetical protein